MKMKIIISGVIFLICALTWFNIAMKPKPKDNYDDLVAQYLQGEYEEQFEGIKQLSKIQNKDPLACDGTVFWTSKVKDSYKYYYKAYSAKDDMEFYVCYDRTKNGDAYVETFYDTYSTFLAIRNNADEIIKSLNDTGLDKLIKNSYVIKNRGPEIQILDKDEDIIKELSVASVNKSSYLNAPYYSNEKGWWWGSLGFTDICFRIELNLDDVVSQYKNAVIQFAQSAQGVNNSFNKFSPGAGLYIYIETNLITSDNYDIRIDGFRVDGASGEPEINVYYTDGSKEFKKPFYDYQ